MSSFSRYRSGHPATDNVLTRVDRDLKSLEDSMPTSGNIPTYTVATLSAATSAGLNFVLVSDETGGFTAAFYNGTNWLRVQDRAVCS